MATRTANMSKESCSEEKGLNLLHQLEDIFENDPLIDEMGYIHPSQFSLLNDESGIPGDSPEEVLHPSAERTASSVESLLDASNQENLYFWNRDHKLGISTQILLQLYRSAKQSFMSAFKQYKASNIQSDKVVDSSYAFPSCDHLESILMRHSRSLLLLSCDFITAWNCRKYVLSKKNQPSVFMDELHLSALVLSYAPKSEQAWSHRRWVIKSISANCSNFNEILEKESELVEKIAERSKMNYRAWNHRCWLVSYMKTEQVLHELKRARNWAAQHIADNSCFHYRRRLLLKILEDSSCRRCVSSGYNFDMEQLWKDELDWNRTLVNRFVGREALWLHRRFLSSCWINHFLTESSNTSNASKETASKYHEFGEFLENELCLAKSCSTILDNDFEDLQSQAKHSACYILWLRTQVPKPLENELLEKLRGVDLLNLLNKSCPERSSLFNDIMK
ncbi:protein prenyltransferase alpha subunit repeat-containing protein 1 isoform X2 [Neltuma alba]|uniref:protein prenyltransferase alpha subunit repeat-containing protein 1 isoform X2 n=1 Tax=Neltuma alba TaxID=207710 RepID=UPI0010A49C10|nr:protein prenyltransferase alpha subunit repeat-containing protein 1 isoform X2 [Prosopis alba]